MSKKKDIPAELEVDGTTEYSQEVKDEIPAAQAQGSEETREDYTMREYIMPRFSVNHPHGVNLRAGPGKEHPVLYILPYQSVVTCASTLNRGDWMRVTCDQGDGWVDGKFMVFAGFEGMDHE